MTWGLVSSHYLDMPSRKTGRSLHLKANRSVFGVSPDQLNLIVFSTLRQVIECRFRPPPPPALDPCLRSRPATRFHAINWTDPHPLHFQHQHQHQHQHRQRIQPSAFSHRSAISSIVTYFLVPQHTFSVIEHPSSPPLPPRVRSTGNVHRIPFEPTLSSLPSSTF
jgi:hypothetical protein